MLLLIYFITLHYIFTHSTKIIDIKMFSLALTVELWSVDQTLLNIKHVICLSEYVNKFSVSHRHN